MRKNITVGLAAALIAATFWPGELFAQNAPAAAGTPPAKAPAAGIAAPAGTTINKRALTTRNPNHRHRHHRRNMYWRTGNTMRTAGTTSTPMLPAKMRGANKQFAGKSAVTGKTTGTKIAAGSTSSAATAKVKHHATGTRPVSKKRDNPSTPPKDHRT